MEQLFQHGLSNAAAAALLAIVAAVATRIWRNPQFAYAAWLIVLIRLVAPPLVAVNVPAPTWLTLANYGSNLSSRAVGLRPLGPRMNAAPTDSRADTPTELLTVSTEQKVREAGSIARPNESEPSGAADRLSDVPRPSVRRSALDAETKKSGAESKRSSGDTPKSDVPTVESIGRRQESERRSADSVSKRLSPLKRFSITQLLTAIWLGGTCGYLLLVSVRAVRFSRALRAGRLEVSESLRAEAVAVAATVGLRRLPKMAMLAAPLPPFVWPGWRPTVLLPQALVESLGVSQRRLLLLHEFVHLRRLDHRVRWFQIGVVALCWWNPIAWWAARRLERAEEECCDAAVLQLQPDQAEGYGQTLVAVTEFLSTGKLPAPALSIGIVRKNHLKRRLTMILSGPRWPGLSKTRFVTLALVGAVLVAVTWTFASAQNESPTEGARIEIEKKNAKTSPKLSDWPAANQLDPRLAALLKLEPLKPEAGDDERQKQLKERYNVALRHVLQNQKQLELGAASAVDRLCLATRALFEAELASVTSRHDKMQILARYVDYCNRIWTVANTRQNEGSPGGSPDDEALARAARFRAETRLNEFLSANDGTSPKAAKAQQASSPAGESRLTALLKLEPLKPEPGDDQLQKLLKERYNAAVRAERLYHYQYDAGSCTVAPVCAATSDLFEAELALVSTSRDAIRVLERYLDIADTTWTQTDAKLKAGGVTSFTPADEAQARAARLEAEIKLLRFRGGLKDRQSERVSEIAPQATSPQTLTKQSAKLPAVSPDGDATVATPSGSIARPNGAASFAGPAPDIHNASGPLNPSGKSLVDLVKFDDQHPQPGESAQRKQLMERYNDALHSVKSKVNQFEQGKTSAELVCNAAREFTDARLALFEDPWQRIPIANWYSVFALRTWREAEAKLHAGGNTRENREDEEAAQKAFLDARAEYAAVIAALPALMTSKLAKILPHDSVRVRLLKQRYNAALETLRAFTRSRQTDPTMNVRDLTTTARQLLDAGLALAPEDRVQAFERYIELLQFFEKLSAPTPGSPPVAQYQFEAVHEARLEAEVELLDARKSAFGQQGPSVQAAVKALNSAVESSTYAAAKGKQRQSVSPSPLPALPPAEPLKAAAGEDDRKRLLVERYNAALKSLKSSYERQMIDSTASFTDVVAAARQLLAADVALHKSGDVVPSYERYFELLKFVDDTVTSLRKDRTIAPATYETIHEARLDAELKLLDVRGARVARAAESDWEEVTPYTDRTNGGKMS